MTNFDEITSQSFKNVWLDVKLVEKFIKLIRSWEKWRTHFPQKKSVEIAYENGKIIPYTIDQWVLVKQLLLLKDETKLTCWDIDIKGLKESFNNNFADLFANRENRILRYNYDGIWEWDINWVTDISGMFSWTTFNSSSTNNVYWLDNWDVSSVEYMNRTFMDTRWFNEPLNNWDIKNLKSAVATFKNSANFNQPLDKWNTSNLEECWYIFSWCTSFNQDVSHWDMSKNVNMKWMFMDCKRFNHDITQWWNHKSSSLKDMFNGCQLFDGDVSNLVNEHVTSVRSMFANCLSFTWKWVETWDMTNVKSIECVCEHCWEFNWKIDEWKLHNIESVRYAFRDCEKLKYMIQFGTVLNHNLFKSMYSSWWAFVDTGFSGQIGSFNGVTMYHKYWIWTTNSITGSSNQKHNIVYKVLADNGFDYAYTMSRVTNSKYDAVKRLYKNKYLHCANKYILAGKWFKGLKIQRAFTLWENYWESHLFECND